MIAFCAFQVRWPGHRRVHVDRPFLPFRGPVAVSTFFLPVFFTFSFLPSCSSAPLLLRCRLQQKKVPSSPPIHSTMQWSEREIPPLVVWWENRQSAIVLIFSLFGRGWVDTNVKATKNDSESQRGTPSSLTLPVP